MLKSTEILLPKVEHCSISGNKVDIHQSNHKVAIVDVGLKDYKYKLFSPSSSLMLILVEFLSIIIPLSDRRDDILTKNDSISSSTILSSLIMTGKEVMGELDEKSTRSEMIM